MGKRIILASVAVVAMLSTAAYAQHAIGPDESGYVGEPSYQPVGEREVCSTIDSGYGEIRTDCRTEPLAEDKGNPALRGICTTYYGRRTCY